MIFIQTVMCYSVSMQGTANTKHRYTQGMVEELKEMHEFT